jgi:hypothetical protein
LYTGEYFVGINPTIPLAADGPVIVGEFAVIAAGNLHGSMLPGISHAFVRSREKAGEGRSPLKDD